MEKMIDENFVHFVLAGIGVVYPIGWFLGWVSYLFLVRRKEPLAKYFMTPDWAYYFLIISAIPLLLLFISMDLAVRLFFAVPLDGSIPEYGNACNFTWIGGVLLSLIIPVLMFAYLKNQWEENHLEGWAAFQQAEALRRRAM